MSADNGLYIAKIDGKYKVIHAQNIEDADETWWDAGASFDTKEAAIVYAHERAENYQILEYGVVYLGEVPPRMTEWGGDEDINGEAII